MRLTLVVATTSRELARGGLSGRGLRGDKSRMFYGVLMKELRDDQSNANMRRFKSVGQNVPRTTHTEIKPERFAVRIMRTPMGGAHDALTAGEVRKTSRVPSEYRVRYARTGEVMNPEWQ